MKVFWSASAAGKSLPASVAALGKFEALHLGHRKLIRTAVRRARALATPCLVVTFDPSPAVFFGRRCRQPLLSPERKLEILGELGVEGVVYLPFDRNLACMAPEAFARDVLARGLRVLEVHVGTDFCFGKNRSGSVADLANFGREHGFMVRTSPLVHTNGDKISASRIRRLIRQGRTSLAQKLLGWEVPKLA